MRQVSLDQIAPLLEVLRANPALVEVRPTMFHLNGREFLHFHDYPNAVWADVRLTKRTVRMRVSSPMEKADLLAQIDACLSAADERARNRAHRGERHRG